MHIERDGRELQIMPVDVGSFGTLLTSVNNFVESFVHAMARCRECHQGFVCAGCFDALRVADTLKTSIQETLLDIKHITDTMTNGVQTAGSA